MSNIPTDVKINDLQDILKLSEIKNIHISKDNTNLKIKNENIEKLNKDDNDDQKKDKYTVYINFKNDYQCNQILEHAKKSEIINKLYIF